ncbi:MAG: MASE1 domain-containing protein [Phycisphaerales bacterium]|nr:MASE1 domain-containing protein [Phycisphaerales bacterium]
MPVGPPTPVSLPYRLAEIAVVAFITCVAMHLGQSEQAGLLRQSGVSPLWPATGINIALVFLLGPRVLLGIYLGSLIDNTLTFGRVHPSIPVLAPIADTIEPLLALWLYRVSGGQPQPLARSTDVIRFGLTAAFAAPALSAALGVAMLWHIPDFVNNKPPIRAWIAWGLPAGVGALVVTPALLCWNNLPRLPWSNTLRLHAAGMFVSLAALEYWVFGNAASLGDFGHHLLIFLVLPIIVWAALVFGARGGAIAVLVISLVAIIGAVRGLGPFNNLPLVRALLILQVYLAAFSAVSLLLGAVTEERAAAYRASLKQAQTIQLLFEELNHRVRNNLASLLSLIDLSRSASGDVDRFANLIAGRVQAMAEIHSVLASGRWVSMTIDDLLRSIAPPDAARRIDCDGPSVQTPPHQAMPLGLVLHELVVNSLKYGALASSDGRVRLKWSAEPDGAGLRIRFTWREMPSSRVSPPPRNSHDLLPDGHHANGEGIRRSGLDLIAGLIRSDLRGSAKFSFPPDGALHSFDVHLQDALNPA